MLRKGVDPGFRAISENEAGLIRMLLAKSFPGSAELREQFAGISVATIDQDGSLRLATSVAVPAAVDRRIPIEASYADRDGVRVHLLIHVVDGYLDELEIFREDSLPPMEAPGGKNGMEFEFY